MTDTIDLGDQYQEAIIAEDWQKAWDLAKKIDDQDPERHLTNASAANITTRNSTVNRDELFDKITENVNNDFAYLKDTIEDGSDRLYMYSETAISVGYIAFQEEGKSLASLNLLDKITQKTLENDHFSQDITPDKSSGHAITDIMIAYSKCQQDENRAIKSIDNINRLQHHMTPEIHQNAADANPYYGSLTEIMYNVADKNKEQGKAVAGHIFRTTKEPETPKEADAYLALLVNTATINPELAGSAMHKMNKIFKKYNTSENIQKSVLSHAQNLSAHKYSFDKEDRQLFEQFTQFWKNRIDFEELTRKRGQPTDWKDEQSFAQQKERDFSKDKKQEIDPKIFEFDNELGM